MVGISLPLTIAFHTKTNTKLNAVDAEDCNRIGSENF